MIVIFWIFRILTGMAARLPFTVLYFISGIIRFILQYVIRYRRKIIIGNLTRSFPEKSEKEIRAITGKYYRNLSQIMVEVIKLERIKPEKLKSRFSFSGLDHMTDAFSKNRSVILAIGHCGNWEWMGTVLGQVLPEKGYAIVKPLSDQHFNGYMESLRHRINPNSTIPFQHTLRAMLKHSKEFVSFNVFAADQTPTKSDINYWSTFFHQDTPFFTGVEKLAKSLDFSVVFMDIKRTGKGFYHGDIHPVTHDPKQTAEHEITENYIRLLERAIRSQPDNWLWSHRRWKFSRNTTPA